MALSRVVESRTVAVALPGPAARPSSWLRLALPNRRQRTVTRLDCSEAGVIERQIGVESHLSMGSNV